MRERVENNEIVLHFKGDYYLVLDTNVINTETGERMVYYRALYDDNKSYIRPYDMFMEKCNDEQYKKYNRVYRFTPAMIPSVKK